MKEYIEREALIKAILDETCYETVEDLEDHVCTIAAENGWIGGIRDAINVVMEAESLSMTVKVAEWNGSPGTSYAGYVCTSCGRYVRDVETYCPNCGAFMLNALDIVCAD